MKSTSKPRHLGFIEPLESRIAPAVIYIGYPANGQQPPVQDTQYDTGTAGNPDTRPAGFNSLHFVATFNSTTGQPAADLISQAVDEPGATNTYYLKLSPHDQVHYYTSTQNYNNVLINVVSGNAVAFFTDLNHDHRYEEGEFTGLALGRNASLEINGRVYGDVVTALTSSGAIDTSHLVSSNQGIGILNVAGGNVYGDILSGGSIGNLHVSGSVNNVLAGTAANGAHFDFFQLADPAHAGQFLAKRFTVDFTNTGKLNEAPQQPLRTAGASIANAVIGSLGYTVNIPGQPSQFFPGVMQAGDGGLGGGAGGVLNNIWIQNDDQQFALLAGSGGAGTSSLPSGGAGGYVNNIYVSGVAENSPNTNANELITIEGGHGGNATIRGLGGNGGAATQVFVGYDVFAGKATPSLNLSGDNVLVEGGVGGAGKVGGAGGTLNHINARVLTPAFHGGEISFIGGTGGDHLTDALGGAAGQGGSVYNSAASNLIGFPGSDILIEGGSAGSAVAIQGGNTVAVANGAAGGSVINTTVLGFGLHILAGNGSDGIPGGVGGSVGHVTIASSNDVGILNRDALINAGHGGSGTLRAGGAGGVVSTVTSNLADYNSFQVDSGLSGNGGSSSSNLGGAGGSVLGITIQDTFNVTIAGAVNLRAGDAGSGARGGGVGGTLGFVNLTGAGLMFAGSAGAGGNATASGIGGAGGSVGHVNAAVSNNFNNVGEIGPDGLPVYVTATLTAGSGGNGAGKGRGGSAGNIVYANLNSDGAALLTAGQGGNGVAAAPGITGAAPGSGGAVVISGAFSKFGSTTIEGGNAGGIGAGAAPGGSILGGSALSSLVGARAATNLTIVAGDGHGGGAGGDVFNVTYGSSAVNDFPAPTGNILVRAGAGSGTGSLAGRGGAIANLTGLVTSGPGNSTIIQAGAGGSAPSATGAGGSVSNIVISGGGAAGALFTVAAGDAGNSAGARVGGNGGNVNFVQVTNLDANAAPGIANQTIFRSVAAGNGGSASLLSGHGGAGGTISGVYVQAHDIGVRTGQKFGFDTMGGLFAGVGGAGKVLGVNGSVNHVNANAIASIVAGRTLVPQLALKVDHIYVNDNTVLLTQRSFVLPGGYTFTYGNDTTSTLPSGATRQQVQNALNALPAIATAGGVSVSYGAQPGTYVVLFNKNGTQQTISGTESIPLNAVEQIEGVTTALPVVEIQAGSQTLSLQISQPGEYQILLGEPQHGEVDFVSSNEVQGDANSGIQAQESISLTDLQSDPTSQVNFTFSYTPPTQGSQTITSTTPNLPGNSNAVTIENALNQLPSIMAAGGVTVQENPSTPGAFNITFNTAGPVEPITGAKLRHEAQQLDLGVLQHAATGTFTLNFEGQTTGALPSNANAQQIQTALNQLPAVQNAGDVTVTNPANSPGVFNITFGNVGEVPLIQATADVQEIQSLDLNHLVSEGANSGFSLTFGNQTTPVLSPGASAQEIQAAINSLPNLPPGGVTVTPTGAPNSHTFNITFASTGSEPAFVENDAVSEIQTLDVSSVDHVSTGHIVLSFKGESTGLLPGNATASDIQTALDSLQSVQATGPNGMNGTVTVTPGKTADQFNVKFNSTGAEPLIVGTGEIAEQQRLEVYAPEQYLSGDNPPVTKVAPGDFTLSYDGSTTATIPGGSSAGTVAAALNALPPIQTLGGVNVTDGVDGIYAITFKAAGIDPDLIIGTQVEPLVVSTPVTGSGSSAQTEVISAIPKGAFDPAIFANADLVGAIYNPGAIDGNIFHYIHNGQPAKGNFQPGDTPIDGIVMAQTFDQSTVNFTPEAKFTSHGFFDNDNIV